MKKINVEKNEGIAEVIDRMLAVEDGDILLVLPKQAALGKSASNFRLLKREAMAADKTVRIESPDEEAIAFAEMNGLDTADAPGAAKRVSDIMPKSAMRGNDDVAGAARKKVGIKLTVHADSDEDSDEQEEDEEVTAADDSTKEEEEKMFSMENRFFKPRAAASGGNGANASGKDEDDEENDSRGGGGKAAAWIIGIIVILGAVFYGVTIFFGHAEVTIDFTQTPWNYQGNVIADKNVAATVPSAGLTAVGSGTANTATPGTITIPAQIFTAQKNITQLFAATGPSVNGSTKAQGTITIYNDYSSASQELVATTRFVTPNGQIFRLVNDVTIPGAAVAGNGVITPSSITAPIIADQGGSAYNVGPIAKLTIPGFQNNPAKYAGFYGAITGATSGGGSGTHPVPTVSDIAAAKASTTAILQADLQGGLTASYTNNFKILDGATDIQVGKLTVNTSTDANGNFSVFGEASLTAIGFDETALENYLLAAAQAAEAGSAGGSANATSTFKTVNLNYSNVQANFSAGQVSFSLSGTGSIEPAFSPSNFAASLAGQSISAARTTIASLPELSNGTISVWPVWLWNMPADPQKIQVTAN
jgi:hypothetical protein